jgi:hypothetical protein
MNTLLTSDEMQNLPGDFGVMLAQSEQALLTVQELAISVDGSIAPIQQQIERIALSAEQQMMEVGRTMETVEGVMDPRAPVMIGLVSTLNELQLAAESLRRAADLIERQPGVLLRGRARGGN